LFDGAVAKLMADLRRSARLTGKAKDAIIAENAEIVRATRKARELIHKTCGSAEQALNEMLAALDNSPPPADDDIPF
jgi:hypothetical protein